MACPARTIIFNQVSSLIQSAGHLYSRASTMLSLHRLLFNSRLSALKCNPSNYRWSISATWPCLRSFWISSRPRIFKNNRSKITRTTAVSISYTLASRPHFWDLLAASLIRCRLPNSIILIIFTRIVSTPFHFQRFRFLLHLRLTKPSTRTTTLGML